MVPLSMHPNESMVISLDFRPALRSDNYPLDMGMLPRRYRSQLVAVQRFARHVDDLGLIAREDRVALLEAVAAEVRSFYAGRGTSDPIVEGLRPLREGSGVPIELLLDLVDAQLADHSGIRFDTFTDLLEHCRFVASPFGEILLHIFHGATSVRIALAERVWTALRLLQQLENLPADYTNDRVYVPQADLRRFNVAEEELEAPSDTVEMRALVAFEVGRALSWLDAGAVLVSTLQGWARLTFSAYVIGGRAAARRLLEDSSAMMGAQAVQPATL